jgi:luciferase family oxidoreductase group 1
VGWRFQAARSRVPIWILGSSRSSAALAAELGRPFAFASHFAPAALGEAIETYRAQFRPSEQLAAPYLMLGFNVIAADDEGEAHRLASSMQRAVLETKRGIGVPLQPPNRDYVSRLPAADRDVLNEVFACSAIGSPVGVAERLSAFAGATGASEIILSSYIFEHRARLRSYELVAEAMELRDATSPFQGMLAE